MSLDEKPCVVCGRTITWRKAWEKNWNEIKYCSDQCRKSRSKDLSGFENQILELLKKRGRGLTICPSEVLPMEEKKDKLKMEEVRQAARRLVHKGQLEITQKGQVVDPSEFKGAIRLRLKS